MSKAPVGSEVKITYDSLVPVEQYDYIQTPTGRTYLVIDVRLQKKGMHRHRKHIRAIVMPPDHTFEYGATIHPLYWYPRDK